MAAPPAAVTACQLVAEVSVTSTCAHWSETRYAGGAPLSVSPALGVTTQAPLYIDDSSTLTVMEMRAKCRRLKAEHGLSLIIVDYLQLMSGYGRVENRNQEISGISRGLKALAKELNVPVIALSQLSRAPEQRQGDHKPQLSDLRESGSIEQDADVVLFVFREEYYLSNKEPRPGSEEHLKWQTEMDLVMGKAELIIGKQRHGPTGTVELQFDGTITKFSSLAKIDHLPDRIG